MASSLWLLALIIILLILASHHNHKRHAYPIIQLSCKMSCSNSSDDCFVEIESPEVEELMPEWIDCYVIENIDRTICGPLSKDLSAILPLRCPATSSKSSAEADDMLSNACQFPRTDHLKRTRRRAATDDEIKARANALKHKLSSSSYDTTSCRKKLKSEQTADNESHNDTKKQPKKKQKEESNQNAIPWSLDVLIGSVDAVDDSLNSATIQKTSSLLAVLAKYGLSDQHPSFTRRSLPGRAAKNKEERDEWNKTLWPTLFFEKKTTQYKQEELALTSDEVNMMKNGMQEALSDALMGKKQWMEWKEQNESSYYDNELSISGAVVMDPQTGSVVSRASQERKLQGMSEDSATTTPEEKQIWESFPDDQNILCTAPLLAIQGVSRIERKAALSSGMESEEFKRGQYLCTGYDVYLTKEPNIFEAMSLVHSRVRRVIFGIPDDGMGGLGGAKSSSQDHASGIHNLPGTNHHYRAFRLNLSDGNDDNMTRKSLVKELYNLHPDNKVDC